MGGEVLELLNDRAQRLEREAEQRGIEQGIEQGVTSLSEKLERLGVDASLIQEAVAELRSESAEK